MRDKRMSNPSQGRAGETASAARPPARSLPAWHIRALVIVILMTRPALQALAVDGREQQQIHPQAAPPDVQITQVKALPALKDKSTTEIEIRWTALVPHLTTLDEFDVVLEVHYSDGSRGIARNHQLKSTARAILLSLATHPRTNRTAVLSDFKASLNVRFRMASSVAVVHQVVASQSDNVRASSGSSSARQPEVFITSSKLVTRGCSTGHQCVDVKWRAAAGRKITISEFTASVYALHKDGTQTTDSITVGGHDRQARLQAGLASVEVDSLKVSLVTSFTLLDSKTAVREGTFSIDQL